MKNIYWIVLAIAAVIVSSCSKGEEDTDDKLNGKTFEFERYYVRTDRSTSVHNWSTPCEYLENFEKEFGYDFSGYFDFVFPDFVFPRECYGYSGVSTVEYIQPTDEVISDSIFSLTFYDNICSLDIHSVKCSVLKGEKLNRKLHTLLFKGGRYVIAGSDFFVVVKKDAFDVVDKLGGVSVSSLLDDYKCVIKGKSDYAKLLEKPVDASEQFTYKRTGEEIVFTNKDKELYGKIDFEKMILKLEQISPTKEVIGEFKLN